MVRFQLSFLPDDSNLSEEGPFIVVFSLSLQDQRPGISFPVRVCCSDPKISFDLVSGTEESWPQTVSSVFDQKMVRVMSCFMNPLHFLRTSELDLTAGTFFALLAPSLQLKWLSNSSVSQEPCSPFALLAKRRVFSLSCLVNWSMAIPREVVDAEYGLTACCFS